MTEFDPEPPITLPESSRSLCAVGSQHYSASVKAEANTCGLAVLGRRLKPGSPDVSVASRAFFCRRNMRTGRDPPQRVENAGKIARPTATLEWRRADFAVLM